LPDQLLQQQYGGQGLVPIGLTLQLPPGFSVQGGPQLSKRCACKKARCLKLYCVCFAAGGLLVGIVAAGRADGRRTQGSCVV